MTFTCHQPEAVQTKSKDLRSSHEQVGRFPSGDKTSLRSWIFMTSRESRLLAHKIQARCITRCLVKHTFKTTGTPHTINDRCKISEALTVLKIALTLYNFQKFYKQLPY